MSDLAALTFPFRKLLFGVVLLVAGTSVVFSKVPDELELRFQNSNKAMIEKDYGFATENYSACLNERESANLHHNMGVASYLDGDIGIAVLHLEKTCRLSMSAISTQEVLSLIRRSEGLSYPQYTVIQQMARALPEMVWMGLMLVGFWGMLIFGVYFYLMVKRASIYRDLAILSSIVFLLTITACIGLYEDSRLGVLLAEENGLKVIPTQESESFLVLKGGETAKKIRENNGFVFIETNSKARGWVPSDQFRLIR
jgi:hypothetical protein